MGIISYRDEDLKAYLYGLKKAEEAIEDVLSKIDRSNDSLDDDMHLDSWWSRKALEANIDTRQSAADYLHATWNALFELRGKIQQVQNELNETYREAMSQRSFVEKAVDAIF